jgi:excisionase family DNA binding protein
MALLPFATVDERALDELAQRVAALVIAGLDQAGRSPWMNADEAAEHLRCPVSRIRKLTMTGELPAHRDRRRVLYSREDLDAYVRQG